MEENLDTEVIFEVRGRDKSWRVHYPDEGDTQTPIPWYDKEGKLKTIIWIGGNSGKLTESFQEFETAKEAIKEAKEMGAEEVQIKKVKKYERKKKE